MTTLYSVPEGGAKLTDDGSAPEKQAPQRLTIEDVPDDTLRLLLRWDVSTSKFNMVCNLTLTLFGPVPWVFFFFGAITQSMLIGGIIAATMVIWIPIALTLKNGHPAALAFYVSNPEAAKRIGESCKANIISSFFINIVMGILSWIYLVEPWSRTGIFGAHSHTIAATMYLVSNIAGWACQGFDQVSNFLSKEVSTVWKKKITIYFGKIVEELLDVEAGCTNVMARIAMHQRETEDFARGMATVLSGSNGGGVIFMSCWIFIAVGAIAIPSGATGSERGIQIGLLSFMALFMMTFLITFLRAMTSPNYHWEREKKRLLNDARISNLVGPRVYQWDNFHVWLEGHELSAFKAFGIRVTSRLLRNAGSVLVSTFAIVLYVLLREELRGLLA